MQTIMTRMVADKFGDLKDKPLTDWKTAFLKTWDPKTDFSFGLLHAERFCQITSKLWMARALVKQALALNDVAMQKERLRLASRFMERAEPKMRGLIYEIEASKSSIFREQFQQKHEKKSVTNKEAVAV